MEVEHHTNSRQVDSATCSLAVLKELLLDDQQLTSERTD